MADHPNIPRALEVMGPDVVAFMQYILDQLPTVPTGLRVKWRSSLPPKGNFRFLQLNGQSVANADYPKLVAYARHDPDFVVGPLRTRLPTDPDMWVKY
jgi:hypothetical protein